MELLLAQAHPTIEEHIIRQERRPLVHFFNTTLYQKTKKHDGGYNISHLILDAYSGKWRFFVNLSYAEGDGLNAFFEREGFSSLPSADDIESQIKNINSTGRRYLLEATISRVNERWEVIVGLLDTTAFFDTNEYANDELSFFLNTDLVNNPLALLPSYNPGMILNLNIKKDLVLSAGLADASPDAGNVYLFQTSLSRDENHLALYYFNSPDADLQGFGISGSFTLGKTGLFTRFGKNSSEDYRYFVSGGLVFSLKVGVLGLGYAHRKGRRSKSSEVYEVFYRIPLTSWAHLSLDYQQIYEEKSFPVVGIRLHFEY